MVKEGVTAPEGPVKLCLTSAKSGESAGRAVASQIPVRPSPALGDVRVLLLCCVWLVLKPQYLLGTAKYRDLVLE
jgi:hypothetical protein